jgi:microcystin-dependent protein
MENHLVPPGGIIMWSGAINDIPVGWALCDGSNGTPDLRDRFIVGAGGAYNPGNTGGAQSVALTVAQMPQHNHSASSDSAGGHEHNVEFVGSFGSPPEVPQFNRVLMGRNNSVLRRATESDSGTPVYGIGGDAVLNIPRIDIDISGNHQHNITVNNSGSGDPHENRPPYYALAYIMKL